MIDEKNMKKSFQMPKSRTARGMTHLSAHVIPDFPFYTQQLCINLTKLQAHDMIKKLLDDPTKAGKEEYYS